MRIGGQGHRFLFIFGKLRGGGGSKKTWREIWRDFGSGNRNEVLIEGEFLG